MARATGIRRRHSKGCPGGDDCSCKAGWEAFVYLAREGRKVRKTFERKSEARAWRDEASTAARDGRLRAPSTLTVEQAAWLWLEAAQEGVVRDRSGRTYKPATLRGYEQAWRLRLLAEFGAHRLSDLRSTDLQGYVERLLAEGLAASTIRNTLDPVRALYRRAVRHKLVAVNPTHDLELPAANGRRERIASPGEAGKLIGALGGEDRALWATAFYAGLRRGELRALRVRDVDLGRSEIRVERSWDEAEGAISTKSEAGKRTVPILAVLRDYLDDHLLSGGREGDDLVFGRSAAVPFSASSISKRARKTYADAGLQPITMHEARHTFASMLIDAGVNAKAIQTFMGHATIQMTFDQYGHLMPGSRDQARELVDAYLEAAEQEARTEAATADPAVGEEQVR
jgi:integrase